MQSSPNVENKRILVVDDELQNRKLLQAFLKKLGNIQIVEAQNGEEAVHQAQEQAPDLILMDIMMPGMDGFEACSRIKQEPSTQDVPVIFLSALSDVQSKTQGFASGGVDYVSKPFEAKELHSRVLAHLALKEQTDMLQGRSEWLETEVHKRTQELEASKEELSRHYAYLQNINDILLLSLQEKPLAEVLETGLDIVLQSSWLPTESSGWMYLYNTSDSCFEQVAVRNPEGAAEPQCAELAAHICTCRQELGIQEIITPSAQHQAYKCDHCPQELCCVPIVFEQQVLGLLVFRLPDRQSLSVEEESFLKSIVRTLAGIIVRKRTETTLQESEAWYRALFETTQSATYIIEADGRVGQLNTAFSELVGLSQEAIEGQMYWSDFVHEKDLQMVGMYREMRREDPQSAPNSYEFRFVAHDGQVKQVVATVDKIPDTERTVVSLLDVTERKHFEQELERKALYDTLTGLPNRALFRSIISRLLTQSEADTPHYFAVLFLDLDRFSLLNESLGHQSGDRLLEMAGQRLQEEIGHKGTVCRIGSDEFVVVLDAVRDYSEIIIYAENIRKRINEPFVLDEQTVHTTCCIGIVKNSAQEQYESADDLIRNAEIAMHRAKQEGANTLKDFNPAMHEQTTHFLQTERDLHQALANEEILVFYQPIIDIAQNRLQGFEALVRWEHPERGLVSPGEFIPVAEETDLILPLGNTILELALQQAARWLARPASSHLFVSINLSAKQFRQRDVVQTVAEALKRAKVPPEHLKLEITESVVMSDVETSSAVLSQMQDMGIQLAMDDFGTGYSSLSYLQSFPIDYIKIDRSFVWGMSQGEQNIELIRAIVAMGHSLEQRLIAEGIETQHHLQVLREMGCDLGQGFYFAKPMPADAVPEYIAAWDGAR